MSKQANKTMIGVFVLGAIGLVLMAVLLLGSGKFFRKTYIAVCYFEGSVGGLSVGAPVVFRGVRVGSVKDVILRFNPTNLTIQIPVYIEIDPRKGELVGPTPKKLGENLKPMIDRGLRAKLEMQSIVTGQMQVGFDFYPGKPAKLVGADEKYPEIPTIPTPFQELAKKMEQVPIDEILKKVQSTLEGIERVVNSPEIVQTLQSVAQTAGEARSLVKNINSQVTPLTSNANDTVKDLQKLVRNLDQQTSTLVSSLGETIKDIRSMVQNVDGQIKPLASGIDGTMKDVQTLTKEVQILVRNADAKIDQFGLSVEKTLEAAGTTLQEAQATLRTVGGTAEEDSPLIYQTMQALKELSAAARSLRTLADYIERHPEAVIRGKE
jgi:paraquat-inducible protein B